MDKITAERKRNFLFLEVVCSSGIETLCEIRLGERTDSDEGREG